MCNEEIVKKFILILSIVIIVYGLVVPKSEYVNISIQNDIFIDVPNRDNMENYAKLKDKYPAFSKMNLVDFVNMKKYEKIKNGIYFLGSSRCLSCQNTVPILNYVLKKNGMYAYYIDIIDSNNYNNLDYQELRSELKDYLKNYLEDKNVLTYPAIFVVKNHKIVSYKEISLNNLSTKKIKNETISKFNDIINKAKK